MKISTKLALCGVLTVCTGGLIYAGQPKAGTVITGVGSATLTLSRDGEIHSYRYLNREYCVRHAPIVLHGSGFLHGSGVVRGKNGDTPVSRYALRFDEMPLPMSDLQVTDKDGTRLSGIIRVPVEMLTDADPKKSHMFSVYDRIEARFVKAAPENVTAVRFSLAPHERDMKSPAELLDRVFQTPDPVYFYHYRIAGAQIAWRVPRHADALWGSSQNYRAG